MGRTARIASSLEALKRAFFENAGRTEAPAGAQPAVTIKALSAATGLDIRRAPSKATRKAKAASERI